VPTPAIPIKSGIERKPQVQYIADRCCVTLNEAIGGLVRVWLRASDACDLNGLAKMTPRDVSDAAGIEGFGLAMIGARWLADLGGDGVVFVDFAKNAGLDSAPWASDEPEPPAEVPAPSGREQFFAVFWEAYPKKVGKAVCLKYWKQTLKPGADQLKAIMDGLARWKLSRRWKEGYVVDPIRFLKERRWEDDAGDAGDLFTPPKPGGIPGGAAGPAPKVSIRDKIRERNGG
jgi:hypothetical protein